MLKKAYKKIVVFILAGLLVAACTPGAVDEAPRVIEIETPAATVEDQDLNTRIRPSSLKRAVRNWLLCLRSLKRLA
jgi:hypothetical protein